MKNHLITFVLLFILTSCMSQKIENLEQQIFEDFINSKEIREHFKDEKEIYILRNKNLCEKIDCDRSYVSDGKKVNIWEIAEYFSRGLRDYVIINKIDKVNNKMDFHFHK